MCFCVHSRSNKIEIVHRSHRTQFMITHSYLIHKYTHFAILSTVHFSFSFAYLFIFNGKKWVSTYNFTIYGRMCWGFSTLFHKTHVCTSFRKFNFGILLGCYAICVFLFKFFSKWYMRLFWALSRILLLFTGTKFAFFPSRHLHCN